jgi:Zn finger protein HypA/HybF involved in hydrogenase expression
MRSGGRCLDCGSQFATPSFSEGPKVWDDGLQTVVRFRECRFMCPECLSTNIEPDKGVEGRSGSREMLH